MVKFNLILQSGLYNEKLADLTSRDFYIGLIGYFLLIIFCAFFIIFSNKYFNRKQKIR